MGNILRCFIFLGLLAPNVALGARYEQAAFNYQNKEYKLAYEQFKELAALGNKDAQYALGTMYANGFHVNKELARAYAWFRLSGTKGDKGSIEAAESLKTSLSETQYLDAQEEYESLTAIYGDDLIGKKIMPRLTKTSHGNFKRIKPLVKRSAKYPYVARAKGEFGSALVTYIVGDDGRVKYPVVDSVTSEDFVKPSISAAKSYIYSPAKIGGAAVNTFAVQTRFFYSIRDGFNIEQTKLYLELSELKRKAQLGSSVDRYQYANSAYVLREYLTPGRQEEFYDTLEFFTKAAVDGLPQAKFMLGKSILYGEQCESDFDSSYFWLSDAANDGLHEAQMMLGLERLVGARFDADIDQGLKWLERASKEYEPAKVELAMALTTLDDEALRDYSRAKSLLDSIDAKVFEDKISLYEAQALVHSALGDEKQKLKSLKRLKKQAKKLQLPFDVLASNVERRLSGESILPLKS